MLSPPDIIRLAQILRHSSLSRDAKRPLVAQLADWLESAGGRKFRRPEWCGLALGPVEPIRVLALPTRDPAGIAHIPAPTKSFRAWDAPDKLGV